MTFKFGIAQWYGIYLSFNLNMIFFNFKNLAKHWLFLPVKFFHCCLKHGVFCPEPWTKLKSYVALLMCTFLAALNKF